MTPIVVDPVVGVTQVVLDPAEIDSTRFELDISTYIAQAGIDWGDMEIQAYVADQERGSSPVDFRIPNRQVTIPLILKDWGITTLAQAKSDLQAKTALFQSEGGSIKRVTTNGGTVFADVVNATLKLPDSWLGAHRGAEIDALLILECIPDWYGAEITLADHTETTLPELVFTETNIKGDYPGRVRIVVDEDSGNDQLGLIWGIRSRHYSSASTARLAYEAEALTPLDTAAITTTTGASGGGSNNVVRHSNLATGWTPVLSTNLLAGTFLTHTGTYRVFARLYSDSGSAVRVRFVWDVGDLTLPAENAPWTFPGASNFYLADLGEIRLDPAPTGAHRWQGQIQAKGAVGAEFVRVDRLYFVPVDEGMGILRAPITLTDGMTAASARDEFNQTAGALTGKTLPVGGTWTAVASSDADDFAVETAGMTAERTANNDADINTGRYVKAGTTSYTNVVVQTDLKASTRADNADEMYLGAFARLVDINNWLMVVVDNKKKDARVKLRKRVTGTVTTLASVPVSPLSPANFYSLRLRVDSGGRYMVWFGPQGASLDDPIITGQDSTLATSGALASGTAGLYDAYADSPARTRNYDNVKVWAPLSDAVAFASQSVQLGTDGHFREDSAGVAYGPVSFVEGDLPRLPPSGLEGRTVETIILTTRGDVDQLPDSGIDDKSARAYYGPSYLQSPES